MSLFLYLIPTPLKEQSFKNFLENIIFTKKIASDNDLKSKLVEGNQK